MTVEAETPVTVCVPANTSNLRAFRVISLEGEGEQIIVTAWLRRGPARLAARWARMMHADRLRGIRARTRA